MRWTVKVVESRLVRHVVDAESAEGARLRVAQHTWANRAKLVNRAALIVGVEPVRSREVKGRVRKAKR